MDQKTAITVDQLIMELRQRREVWKALIAGAEKDGVIRSIDYCDGHVHEITFVLERLQFTK